ncbi:MAG: hypothetical protein KAH25_04615, partial [Bacteroidales bacterium]|nr:hypothetical protein [Bacteroidales bacterium]
MKKSFLLLMISSSFVFSAIDEYKTDVYFANGILTDRQTAKKNAENILKPGIIDKYGIDYYNKHIGKVGYAYNETNGFWPDGIETYLQKFGLQSLVDFMFKTAHEADLEKQIKQYKNSIKAGHKVLVIAHSQGNLFTNKVYKKIQGSSTDWWMSRYFKVVSIASPMCFKITPHTPGISWDNDKVPNLVGLCPSDNINNKARKVSWEFYDGTPRVSRPTNNYIYDHQLGEIYRNSWKGIESGNDENVHAFTFYMGQPLKEGNKKKPNFDEAYLNPFDDKNITNNDAKDLIMTNIKSQIDELEKLSSQWKPKNLGCTCKTKYAKMTHAYDPKNMDQYLEGV